MDIILENRHIHRGLRRLNNDDAVPLKLRLLVLSSIGSPGTQVSGAWYPFRGEVCGSLRPGVDSVDPTLANYVGPNFSGRPSQPAHLHNLKWRKTEKLQISARLLASSRKR